MIWMPWLMNQFPNQPLRPYTSTSASPTMTGETTNGRSISPSRILRPRTFERASSSAAPTPKIVFSGTAISAITNDSQNALTAAGVVAQFHAVANPCSNVRAKIAPIGISSSTSRYRSATARSDSLDRWLSSTASPPPAQAEQHQERDQQQHDRQR